MLSSMQSVSRDVRPWLALAAGLTIAHPARPASAQDIDAHRTRITARSDVRMEIESGPGTGSQKLTEIGGAVGGQLGRIRACYAEVTEARPTVQGKIKLEVQIRPRGQARVEVTENTVDDRRVQRCTLAAIREARYAGIEPPGSAFVLLTFSNTAAEGVERMQARSAEEAAAPVRRDADGHPTAEGGPANGLVHYRVTGVPGTTEDTVAAAWRTLRSLIPHLLDARRKAGRRRTDPAGEVDLVVRVNPRGRAQVRVTRNTVEQDDLAQRFLLRAFRRHAQWSGDAPGRFKVTVRFASHQAGEDTE